MKFFKDLFKTIPQEDGGNERELSAPASGEPNAANDERQPNARPQANVDESEPKAGRQTQATKPKPDKKPKRPRDEPAPTITEVSQLPDSEFHKLELPMPINRAIAELGFTAMTPVQAEVLPHALDGKDVVAQAQTGTGKTAAFLIAIITYHLENPEEDKRPDGVPFALIIAPTRELVMQIAQDAEDLAKFAQMDIVTLVGGMDYDRQRNQCRRNVDIVVATPGRLLDFCRNKIVDLGEVETVVIDEADRMLSMGFIPDVRDIIRRTPHKDNRQTQFFSATFSYDIRTLAESWTKDAVNIAIEPEKIAVDTVEQLVYMTSTEEKYTVLYNLITKRDLQRVIVFVNRRDETRSLESRLRRDGIVSGLLSGEVHQRKRIKTLDDFRGGRIRVLVATDVAGRGIHVDDVSHVVNYNLPEDPEDYIHRIGRTGRAGAMGISISLACEDDAFMLPQIREMLGTDLKSEHPPEDLMTPIEGGSEPVPIERRPSNRGGRPGQRSGQRSGSRHGRR